MPPLLCSAMSTLIPSISRHYFNQATHSTSHSMTQSLDSPLVSSLRNLVDTSLLITISCIVISRSFMSCRSCMPHPNPCSLQSRFIHACFKASHPLPLYHPSQPLPSSSPSLYHPSVQLLLPTPHIPSTTNSHTPQHLSVNCTLPPQQHLFPLR